MTISVTHQTLDGVDVKEVLHLNEEIDLVVIFQRLPGAPRVARLYLCTITNVTVH